MIWSKLIFGHSEITQERYTEGNQKMETSYRMSIHFALAHIILFEFKTIRRKITENCFCYVM